MTDRFKECGKVVLCAIGAGLCAVMSAFGLVKAIGLSFEGAGVLLNSGKTEENVEESQNKESE